MDLKIKLKSLRNYLGHSQVTLGQELGVSDAFISQLEHGRRLTDRNHYRKLAKLVADNHSQVDENRIFLELVILDFKRRDPELYELLCFNRFDYEREDSDASCPLFQGSGEICNHEGFPCCKNKKK
ncbi:MAG: helix-turn-helix transcriptional regulator [Syntrophotaleaceae bacterium]